MNEKQTEMKKYISQLEKFKELCNIFSRITAVSALLSEKNIATEKEFYRELNKFIKEKRETIASK
ncbi:hypothetical protein L2D08_07370 [Domibacillus sp. PGB-M46]|uniref:hypothetical protein n=1 Tax=Domibacillus sp. PGB-M46 TaxID=2910255 RepID=UPI001F58E73A|nr:hypothetical protein [Domibacillus sp. PGB-M46]MCI2254181.1 hypothetical protein [Domibacillus sp. PGB-M46]